MSRTGILAPCDRQPWRATEAGADGARAKLLTREAGER